MKIKNFCGYGTITAKKISLVDNGDTTILTVLVTGDHEQGLIPHYVVPGTIDRMSDHAIKKWLIERFDKRTKELRPFHYNMIVDYMDISGNAVKYVFGYNNDGSILY